MKGKTVTDKYVQARVCDNHSERDAVVITDDNGAHNEIALCEECAKGTQRSNVR